MPGRDGGAPQVALSIAPPPAVAVERALGEERFPAALYEASALHELNAEMAALCAPARSSLVPLTVVSGGHVDPGQPCLLLHPGKPADLRGVLGGWLRGLAGPTCATNGALSPPLELWCASCDSTGSWRPLPGGAGCGDERPAIAGDGSAIGVPRHVVGSTHEGVELVERMLRGIPATPSFVALGVNLRRHSPELGCTFVVSALWVDVGSQELEGSSGAGLRGLREFLTGEPGADGASGVASMRPPHPLLELLASTLRGERALATVVVGHSSDPACAGASQLASLLKAAAPESKPPRRAEVVSVRPGFTRTGVGSESDTESFRLFAGAFQDLCSPPGSPLPELLHGELAVRTCGFPSALLPTLRPYMSRFHLSDNDHWRLIEAAEAELAEFEENGWVVTGMRSHMHPWAPRPLYMQLADCYQSPEAHLTTTSARSYARSQDPSDPMVRTVRRLREDVALCAALLPIAAAHPFNPVRLLRMGGIHSLLNLLSDASALAPGHGEAAPAVDALSPAEIAALALTALAVFAPVRNFLVSQSIFELMAVIIKHPATDRQLLIFLALFTRLCQEPEHKRLAADVAAPALVEQIPRLLGRTGAAGTGLAEAIAAATAHLSPCLPVPQLAPVLRHLLGHLCGSAPVAFHHLACSLATSLRGSKDLDLGAFVPRLLSLVPLEAPSAAAFHGGATGLLALCSHTAATTSLSRRWVAATAAALARQALRSGPMGLSELRLAIPLAVAPRADSETSLAPAGGQWDPQVEEKASMLATLKWTCGDLATKIGTSSGIGSNTASENGLTGADVTQKQVALGSSSPPPELQREKLHGHVRLIKLAEMAESPNHSSFGERPQLRLAVDSDRAEVFFSLSLLPVTHGSPPVTACGCCVPCGSGSAPGVEGAAASPGCGGQLGLWLCELPCGSDSGFREERRRLGHQLDLRPPVHASAAAPGETEHFVSVTLQRGLYTIVPFSSHEVVTTTTAASATRALRDRSRAAHCGCVDLNLAQSQAWERGAHFAAVSVWAESEALEVSEAVPWHQRLEIGGELLAQSAPIWLCPPAGGGPIEVLICVCGRGGDDEDPARFRASEPCLDLWPAVPSRRVRNERTGALRVHLPAVLPEQPVRLACLWQELVDPAHWRQAPPRLVVYSLAPLQVYAPAVAPQPLPVGVCCAAPPQQAGLWQASALLCGGWTGGMSSGFGSLRNPQVAVEVLRPPGRGEELQVDLYLFVPHSEDERSKRPSLAMTIFSRQEQGHLGDGKSADTSRLLEGQLRKELGSSKVVIGSYVTAQVVLSGADARAPFFVVLQNSAPQEVWPWQLRVLARIRPGGRTASDGGGGNGPQDASQPVARASPAAGAADTGAQGAPPGAPRDGGAPDDPPMRCMIVSGSSESGRIYACWPRSMALYVPKGNRNEATLLPGELPSPAWSLSRHSLQPDGLGNERLHIAAAAGAAPRLAPARGRPGAWPAPEQLPLPPPEDAPEAAPAHRAAAAPALADSPRAGPAALPAPGGAADATMVAVPTPKPRGRPVAPPPKLGAQRAVAQLAEAAATLAEADAKPDLSPAALLGPSPPGSLGAQIEARNRADPRRWRRDRDIVPSAAAGEANGALPEIERKTSQSERHARVAALQRRRRHGGYAEEDASTPRMSSLPPTPRQGDGRGRGPASARSSSNKALLGEDQGTPTSARSGGGRSLPPPAQGRKAGNTPELPPLPSARGLRPQEPEEGGQQEAPGKCCHFAGHPVFCCHAEAQFHGGPRRHVVRLERRPGADRLGFGNVAAGPPGAPVLVISWVREGALAAWNAEAESSDGLAVPPQSAILAVNGISGDVLKMREALRAQVVEIEVMTPDRWRYNKVIGAPR